MVPESKRNGEEGLNLFGVSGSHWGCLRKTMYLADKYKSNFYFTHKRGTVFKNQKGA